MNQPKHTPGPWAAYGGISYNSWFKTILAQTEDQRCGFLVADVNGEDRAERDANARLIAAAPELLAALREVVRVFESNPPSIADTVWVTGNSPETLYDHCRAAIAKATGEVTPP